MDAELKRIAELKAKIASDQKELADLTANVQAKMKDLFGEPPRVKRTRRSKEVVEAEKAARLAKAQ